MTPVELAEYLAVLRAHGALEFKMTAPGSVFVEIKLSPTPPSAAPFVDESGAPVNLDEGAPWNARDPIEEANFPGKKAE